jgi:hypothetical protein
MLLRVEKAVKLKRSSISASGELRGSADGKGGGTEHPG